MLFEDDLGPRIEALLPRRRAAVAAACVERVLPLFEVMSDRAVETARHSVRLAWRFAEGETIDAKVLESARDALEAVLPHEDDDRGLAVRTIERVVRAIGGAIGAVNLMPDGASIAAKMALEAVHGFELDDDGKGWTYEEQAFQRAIVELAEKGDVEDVRTGAAKAEAPSFLDRLEEEWGWERDDEGEDDA